MLRSAILVAAGLTLAGLAACGPNTNCVGGADAGGALGGLAGNQFGSGSGKTVATAVGAGAGAYAGTRAAGC
jgi:uncharacterized protein YcfJ